MKQPHLIPLVRAILLLLLLPLLGATGFMGIEGWNFLDSLYMSMITFTTVGFGEIHPLSDSGRIFVMGFLVIGIGVFAYAATMTGQWVVNSSLKDLMGKKNMDSRIKNLKNHFILCGLGRVGSELAKRLTQMNLPFVVIEKNEDNLKFAKDQGWLVIAGDALLDDVLQSAGLENAGGLAAVLSSDADNLYLVLSARLMNKELPIIARATEESSIEKLKKAGANHVISIFHSSAHKIAQMLAHPKFQDVSEVFSTVQGGLEFAQIKLTEKTKFVGKKLSNALLRDDGVVVVGIKKHHGKLLMPAPSDVLLEPNDELMVLATPTVLENWTVQ